MDSDDSRSDKIVNKSEILPNSDSFSGIVNRIAYGNQISNKTNGVSDTMNNSSEIEANPPSSLNNSSTHQPNSNPATPEQQSQVVKPSSSSNWPQKKACRAPLTRRFGHPCVCGQAGGSHHKYYLKTKHNIDANTNNNNSSIGSSNNTTNSSVSLPPIAYTSPLHLYDPISKRCLPTSRNRDMLLKDCHLPVVNSFPVKFQTGPCGYDDLICDPRRFRCACKPPLHLYYESNQTAFGCVPLGMTSSPDGRVSCRRGYVYNGLSKDCQRIFDVNELLPNPSVSPAQFSFVTIVLIWILLLILIVTAKLRKLRTSNAYRNSPGSERRLHGRGMQNRGSYSHTTASHAASAWLHPFIAAVRDPHNNSGNSSNPNYRISGRHNRSTSTHADDGNHYDDTDLFLGHEIEGNVGGSQLSINNQPPKFEEIYPGPQQVVELRPPPNDDLPSYEEAMKMRNTMPSEAKG